MSRDSRHRSRKAMLRLAILAALVVLVAVVHARRSASASPAAGAAGTQGRLLLASTARAEACAMEATGRYTSNLEDLNRLAGDSLVTDKRQAHLSMAVSVNSGGRHFYARATGHGFNDYVQGTAALSGASTVPCQFSKTYILHALRLGQSVANTP